MGEWAEVLDRLLKEVQEDPACKKIIEDSLSYAVYAVAKNDSDIKDTLRNRIKVRSWPSVGEKIELDILWPGAGYNSVACGGSFEVLAQLQKQGLLELRDIMGASGGACSCLLALADSESSSRTLLTYYLVYAKWVSSTTGSQLGQVWRTTKLWREIYRRVLRDTEAFERVRTRGYVAVAAGRTVFQWQNWILHHFADREQCAHAYEASGEASLGGFLLGQELPGLEHLGRCCDGGGILPFPGREGKLAFYHHSFYGSAASCTLETIEMLFRKGVDDTIRMFCDSYDTCKFRSLEYGGAILGFSRDIYWEGDSMSGLRKTARFFHVENGREEEELP
ncbi:unnamed protein product [Effrenium voratum]|nr:unnamed protein product [Effrenium voratum]